MVALKNIVRASSKALILSGVALVWQGIAMAESTKKDLQELQKRLNPLQYRVTQQCGTEPPFNNEYWDNHAAGIYVDVVSGEALFSSLDKFDSGTGWPSFTKPISSAVVEEKVDRAHGMIRTEVRSTGSDSHLGHVFPDGPGPAGQRYCITESILNYSRVSRVRNRPRIKRYPTKKLQCSRADVFGE